MSESQFNRVVLVVADGLGVGAMADADKYGDVGSNTLANTAQAVGGLPLPNLQKLGLGNMGNFSGIAPIAKPLATIGRLAERSEGKDTTTGHWELAGIVTKEPFPTFAQGFPKELVEQWVKEANLKGVLGNYPASGTAIIQELGAEHLRTQKPILYTSADSVFQIAAHEQAFGLERLKSICEIARRITEPYRIGRVIARPFVGSADVGFVRTENRRDYSLAPGRNCLDSLQENGVEVCSVGKIDDIFANRAIDHGNHTGNNRDGMEAISDFLQKTQRKKSLIFANLVDFDMLFGHRRDPKGYANALVELDSYLPKILKELHEGDYFILTGDHGCDPTFRGTDHTREYVPLLGYGPATPAIAAGDRESFADIGAALIDGFGIENPNVSGLGKSFLCKSKTS